MASDKLETANDVAAQPPPARDWRLYWILPIAAAILIAGAWTAGRAMTAPQPGSRMAVARQTAIEPRPELATGPTDPSGINFAFAPTRPNTGAAPPGAPAGMAWIPGGEFSMGCEDPRDFVCGGHESMDDARPIHRVYVDGFWMDKTDVTNEEFAKFVAATGYVTIAEQKPRAEDLPGVEPEKLVAGSTVFTPPSEPVPLDNCSRWWRYQSGANWRHPEGPSSDIRGREKYPVVQVAYADAAAYVRWAAKRLPTEAEWEFAARGGLSGNLYAWGNDLHPDGKYMANTFQGVFPTEDAGDDGFRGIAPVAKFPANRYGLYDMAGNVWQWCSDWYRPDYYSALALSGAVTRNPTGPADSFDPAEPEAKKRVERGGSFLCTEQYCTRYIVGSRGKGEISTASNHLGFRCVRSTVAPPAAASESTAGNASAAK